MSRTLVSRKSTSLITPTTLLGACSQDIEVGNVVIMVNDIWIKADCSDFDRVPASGMVVEKTGSTGCRVANFGKVKVPFLINPGKNYYLGNDGSIIETEPSPLENNFVYSQQIGSAVSDSELILNIKETYMIQPISTYHTFINTRKTVLPSK